EREREYEERLRKGPWEARLIKLADLYSNLSVTRDEKKRRSLLPKAEHAVKQANGDDRLKEAAALLRTLL
ncbi:MAG: hypothetical protein ACYTGC_12605, partial [Planctomycetota bacterium]